MAPRILATTEGATSMMDGGDRDHWNMGGAISDKSPPVINELEGEQENEIKTQSVSLLDGETSEERNDAKDENSENLSVIYS